MYLITGAGGGVGSVSRTVVEQLKAGGEPVRALVHRDDARADPLRELGAEVVVGDLTRPQDVADAMTGVSRMFFSMSVSPDYLQATAVVCAVARESGGLEVIANVSQMTVSQMTLTSTEESRQHRLHWLAEHVMNWSGVPVIHIRPTVFLENPLFTFLAMRSIRERGVLSLPFGTGRTSPIAATDVARVVATVLQNPAGRIGDIYELTGPEVLDIDGLAAQYARALHRPVTGSDIPHEDWLEQVLKPVGLPAHTQQHIATMAQLYRADRYNRATDDVERDRSTRTDGGAVHRRALRIVLLTKPLSARNHVDCKACDQLFDMTDRVVVVTGGTRGIGSALAEGFVLAGARVAHSAATILLNQGGASRILCFSARKIWRQILC